MTVKRIKPNILSDRFEESRTFYNDVIGLDGGEGLDWILFFGTDKREVQLSVMKLDIKAHVHPNVSIEVDEGRGLRTRACGRSRDRLPAHRGGLGPASLLRARSEWRGDQRHRARLISD